MRVVIDARKIEDGGIGTYVRETMRALGRVAPSLEIVALGASRRAPELPNVEWRPVAAAPYGIAEHWRVARAAGVAGADVFHAPHYVVPAFVRGPVVVTIHDLIHVLFPRSAARRLYAEAMIRWAVGRADRVLTVSETTARDLERKFAVDRRRLDVVPNGVAPGLAAPPDAAARLARLGVAEPYLLYVGNDLPHKNVDVVVEAWRRLGRADLGLVLCGPPPRSAEPGVVHTGVVGSEDLGALYAGAATLVLVSEYEGFGLPILEAMSLGTPVVGSDRGAIPEVANGAALLVEPGNAEALAGALRSILDDPAAAAKRRERGLERAKAFTWDAAARATLKAYEAAAS